MPHETYLGMDASHWRAVAAILFLATAAGVIAGIGDVLRRRRAARRWQQETIDRGPGDHRRASRDAG